METKPFGTYGYNAGFFKTYWKTIGEDVTIEVLYFFEGGKLSNFINSVSVALIPKKINASEVKDFMPISCLNVVYKEISKVISNRL